jgi:peptidoglycan lytic transglycosylase G
MGGAGDRRREYRAPRRVSARPLRGGARPERRRRSAEAPLGGARARERRSRGLRPALLAGGAVVIAAVIVIVALTTGGEPRTSTPSAGTPAIVKVLIPEGDTRAEIAAIAKAQGLTGSYLSSSVRSAALDPVQYGAPHDTPSLEGFLFPATYEAYAGSPARVLVEKQLEAFSERFGPRDEAAARALHETPYQLLTVASMIEREAKVPGDRPLIAAVIYNRLAKGMPLGIDATIRYALHDYSRPLTDSQLALSSPYNTRLHRGLPPTPIANPGSASIEAAAHPAHVGYLYYVAAPDGCGEHAFSSSYAQFLRDSAAYQAALAANGGNVPACHKR